MKPDETIYAGEAQFAGWSDSHTGGPIIKLRLPSSDDLDKFRALTVGKGQQAGHLFSVAIVEHDGAGTILPAPEGTKLSDDAAQRQTGRVKTGPYCIEAIDLCRTPLFQRWVAFREGGGTEVSEAIAKEFILAECGIDSRKALDTDEEAKLAFVGLVRVPFMHWRRNLGGDGNE